MPSSHHYDPLTLNSPRHDERDAIPVSIPSGNTNDPIPAPPLDTLRRSSQMRMSHDAHEHQGAEIPPVPVTRNYCPLKLIEGPGMHTDQPPPGALLGRYRDQKADCCKSCSMLTRLLLPGRAARANMG